MRARIAGTSTVRNPGPVPTAIVPRNWKNGSATRVIRFWPNWTANESAAASLWRDSYELTRTRREAKKELPQKNARITKPKVAPSLVKFCPVFFAFLVFFCGYSRLLFAALREILARLKGNEGSRSNRIAYHLSRVPGRRVFQSAIPVKNSRHRHPCELTHGMRRPSDGPFASIRGYLFVSIRG
jgi:hypothetical protein